MASAPTSAAVMILKHHNVSVCVVGEFVLNYYNVPRVCHDAELCVPKSGFAVAAGLLCSTGLFEPSKVEEDFSNYTEYKRGYPCVRTTTWVHPPQTIVIFPAAHFGLDPIEDALLSPPSPDQRVHISKEIPDMSRDEIFNLPLPRLAPLIIGLASRFLGQQDDMAMIGVEQLIDGMNLDESWMEQQLGGADDSVRSLIKSSIYGKKSRIDYYSDNKVTCFIRDQEEAHNIQHIPGRLNDAAIALHQVLSERSVNFGIFGGYAIGALGGVRESKDIDCLASITRAQVIDLLDGKHGFHVIPQTRQDYVAFLWSARGDEKNTVLVEIFCERFPGAQYSMRDVPRRLIQINGLSQGQGVSSFLDPFYLFKGKISAAAERAKFHDSADLRFLAGRFESLIKPRVGELNLRYVGLAIKRYVELELLFGRLGVDLKKAKAAARDLDPYNLPPPAPGDIHRGLLG
ncbi:ser/Thr protein phosphatase [Xylariomycetidae sp. FL2044]|nr:ser/Thr protein phosphatase [Xylariomycetidae sp. FL2044]